jgi:hypothetical protein
MSMAPSAVTYFETVSRMSDQLVQTEWGHGRCRSANGLARVVRRAKEVVLTELFGDASCIEGGFSGDVARKTMINLAS